MMTEIEFIHLLRTEVISDAMFCLFILCAAPSQKMLACVIRDGTICAKNSTFRYFEGTKPITGGGIQLRPPTPIMSRKRKPGETRLVYSL